MISLLTDQVMVQNHTEYSLHQQLVIEQIHIKQCTMVRARIFLQNLTLFGENESQLGPHLQLLLLFLPIFLSHRPSVGFNKFYTLPFIVS